MRKPEFIVHVARRENTLNAMESIASLTSASSQATVSFFGAQLLSWTPTAGRPVIWQTSKEDRDPNSPVRGGIPICLPWFSAPALSKASLGQTQTKHGIARTQTWRMEPSSDPATAVFSLTHTATEEFPHSFHARYSIESSDTLVLGLEVTNTDDHAFCFEQALHTYFAVSDVSTVTLGGLEGAHCEDFLTETSFIEGNTVSFEGPTDRLYHCDARVTLDDPEWQRHHRSCTRDHIELELEHILPQTLKQLYHRYHRPVFRVLLSQALPGLRFIANRSMRSPCGRFCPARHSRFEQ